jgi:hypothetical protein
MLSITEKSNYLSKVVKLSNLRKHTNADRLQCVSIDGNNVITGTTQKDGDLVVFFPVESQINHEFLSFTNSFEDKTLNRDQTVKGYMGSHCRVRAIRLRGEKSEGYIISASVFEDWLRTDKNINIHLAQYVGQEFDTINGITISKKYVIPKRESGGSNVQKTKIKLSNRLIDGQFKLSVDTENLKKNIKKISPDDKITIAYKMHGCNFSMGRILVKKNLNWFERLLKKFGVNIVDSEYDTIYASRSVIKNSRSKEFGNDVWGVIASKYKECLQDGITINGEIVGFTPTGSCIQKGYDYGLKQGECELYVYRMYYTSPSGKVIEFNTDQIKTYCDKVGLKVTPIFYHGKARDLFGTLSPFDEDWHSKFLDLLIKTYNEKLCFMCKNKVPEEGVVIIKNDYNDFIPLKLKSFAFLEMETKLLDNAETNVEDEG